MANGFQADAPDVQFIPSRAGAPPVDTLTGDIIEGVGRFAIDVKGRVDERNLNIKKGELKRSFSELGERAVAVSQMGENDLEVERLSDENVARLSEAEQQMRRLKILKKRGRLSDTALQIEAERILQDKIESAPAFEQEFRRLAASTLGYDPTGSTVQALFGLATQEPEAQKLVPEWMEGTDYAKSYKEIKQLERTGFYSPQQAELALQDVVETIGATRQIENLEAKMEIGSLSSEAYSQQFLNIVVPEYAKDLFKTMFFTNGPNGELIGREDVDAVEVKRNLTAAKSRLMSRLLAEYTEKGFIIDSATEKNLRDRINRQFADYENLAEDSDLLERVTRNRDILLAAYKTQAYRAAPHLAFANELGVAPEFMELLKTPSEFVNVARMIDPDIDAAAEVNDLTVDSVKGVQRIMSGDFDWNIPQAREAHSDIVTSVVSNGTEEGQRAGKRMLEKTGKPGYNISNLAKPELAKYKIRPELQKEYGSFINQQAEIVERTLPVEEIQRFISDYNAEGELQVKAEVIDNKLYFTVDGDRFLTSGSPTGAREKGRVNIPGDLQITIQKLNAINSAAENGWAGDIKKWSPSYLSQWADKFNTQVKTTGELRDEEEQAAQDKQKAESNRRIDNSISVLKDRLKDAKDSGNQELINYFESEISKLEGQK